MADHPLAPENRAYLQTLEAERAMVDYDIAVRMQETGFFRWGFLIYRCDYSDDDLWARFMAHARQANQKVMEIGRVARVVGPYLDWTIVEDREKLGGATKEQVRDMFRVWSDGLSVERDGPGADNIWAPRLPRFQYCIYVGREELETLLPYERFIAQGGSGFYRELPAVKFCLINAEKELVPTFHPLPGLQPPAYYNDDENSESEEEDSEDDDYDIWWVHFRVDHLVVAYSEMLGENMWHLICHRPPELSFAY